MKFRCLAVKQNDLFMRFDIDDYYFFKKIVTNLDKNGLGLLLIAAARKGIPRNVEFMLPMAIGYGLTVEINEALCAAASNCHIAVMECLLKNGADIHYKKNLPLSIAVESGHVEAVSLLLENGAYVHTNNDQLIITCCLAGDYADVLKKLIEYGIDVFKHYHTAYDYCLELKHNECAMVLIQYCDTDTKVEKSTTIINNYTNDEIDNFIENQDHDMNNDNDNDNDDSDTFSYHDSGDEDDNYNGDD